MLPQFLGECKCICLYSCKLCILLCLQSFIYIIIILMIQVIKKSYHCSVSILLLMMTRDTSPCWWPSSVRCVNVVVYGSYQVQLCVLCVFVCVCVCTCVVRACMHMHVFVLMLLARFLTIHHVHMCNFIFIPQ